MQYRLGTLADILQVVQLGTIMHAESKYAHIPYDAAAVSRALHEAVTGADPDLCLIVVPNNEQEIVGAALLHISPYFFCNSLRVASDLALIVHPKWRNLKIARELVRGIEQWAIDKGAHSVVLGVTAPHDPAPVGALYKACSYAEWGSVYRKEL